jgi:uncharacterized protein (DUF58 family)
MVNEPALTPERLLRRLEWRVVRHLDGRLQGEARTLLRGSGTDVVDLHEYQPGDDLRRIDWNVTARTDVPHVRGYLEDRDVTAWLLLDRSPSMRFGPADRLKQVVVAEIAGTMAQMLARGGNRVGAVIFDQEVDEIVPPGTGRRQVLRILFRLMRNEPEPARDRRPTALAGPLRAALGIARRRCVIVVVSDFITEPDWERSLTLLARRHDVVAIQVIDRREFELPAVGLIWVEDAETGEQIFVDSDDVGFQQRLREAARQRQALLNEAARSAGVDLFTVSTDEDLVRALMRIVLALARPEAGIAEPRREGTVVLAFDVSSSMGATDVAPSRMEAARTAARAFVQAQPESIRIGVVAFAATGVISQRPTADRAAVLEAVDRMAPQGGTSLARGIETSLSAIVDRKLSLESSSGQGSSAVEPPGIDVGYYGSAAVILLSDGENTDGPDPESAAAAASTAGVRVYPVGLGSPKGTVLKIDGFSVATALDERGLRQIATTTGGQYFNAADAAELVRIYRSIDLSWTVRTRQVEVSALFALAAALMLGLGSALSLAWFGRVV